MKMNYWTKEDDVVLLEKYKIHRDNCDLKTLAKLLGRTVPFIARKAKDLGLTDRLNHVSMKPLSSEISVRMKNYIKENGHPRGMLGKPHTEKTKLAISKSTSRMWADKDSYLNSDEYRQIASNRMSLQQSNNTLTTNYTRCKHGVVVIGGKEHFYRSEWEVNIAAYYEFLKSKGEIIEWEYEPIVFWFEKIKLGVRSYKPDFRITAKDGIVYYVEVKGWMDDKSKTKIKRMEIYYPNIKLEILGADRYNAISKMKSLIPYWGSLTNGNAVEEIKCSISGCLNKSFCKTVCRKHYYKIYRK